MELDEFFEGYRDSRRIFDAVRQAIEALGSSTMTVTRSQVAFRRRVAFGMTLRTLSFATILPKPAASTVL